MPSEVQFHPEPPPGHVETRYQGRLTLEELTDAFTRTLGAGRDHATLRYLGDCTDLVGGHSIDDLYHLARLLASLNLGPLKEAVILPQLEATRDVVSFWETTCASRGLHVRVFPDRQPALDWLLDPQTDPPGIGTPIPHDRECRKESPPTGTEVGGDTTATT